MNAKPKQQPPQGSTARKTLPDARHSSFEKATELLQRWTESVDRLQGKAFATVNEAVEAIVNEALRSSNVSEDKEAKDFLSLLFESDPHLLDTVERLLVRSSRP